MTIETKAEWTQPTPPVLWYLFPTILLVISDRYRYWSVEFKWLSASFSLTGRKCTLESIQSK